MHQFSSDIQNLYQELIIDHGTNPRNFCHLNCADCTAEGYNPLCGDQVSLFIQLHQNKQQITRVTFQGKGCAISMASASLLTEFVLGKTIHQAIEFSKTFQSILTQENDAVNFYDTETHLGKLVALMGVKAFPARVKCATLAWHAFLAALNPLITTKNSETVDANL